jgi:hypothetical protein
MKGLEVTVSMILIIAALLLAFSAIFWMLNYFGINIITPLCRTFCMPVSGIIDGIMKSLLIGYVTGTPGSTMCNFCG